MPDGSYSVSDIQDYAGYVLKTHGENTDQNSQRLEIKDNKFKNGG